MIKIMTRVYCRNPRTRFFVQVDETKIDLKRNKGVIIFEVEIPQRIDKA